MLSAKTIFISPLDWGLGHATRCVPLIKNLQKSNNIILGVTPLTQKIFNDEFPDLLKVNVPTYNIRYSKKLPIWLKLFLDSPKILYNIKKEHQLVEKLIKKHKINIIVSDNRFGFYSKNVHSIFITHQVFLKTPFANMFLQAINKKFILNFDELWIPDNVNESKSLSGDLSHGFHFHKNVKYLGILSRLNKIEVSEKIYDFLFLISGPEPQQTIFKNLLVEKGRRYPSLKFALACPHSTKFDAQNIEIINSPNAKKLSEVILRSKKIICRSGYSTLMDLHHLGIDFKNIILVPTSSQTEQEYLAYYISNKFSSHVVLESKLLEMKFD